MILWLLSRKKKYIKNGLILTGFSNNPVQHNNLWEAHMDCQPLGS